MSSPAECKIPEEMRAALVEKMAEAIRGPMCEHEGIPIVGTPGPYPFRVARTALTAIEPALAELVGAFNETEQRRTLLLRSGRWFCLDCHADGDWPVNHAPDCPFAPLSKYRRTA